MKRFVVALILIAVIVSYSVIAAFCLNSWQTDVTGIIDEIQLYSENGGEENASVAADKLIDEWIVIEKKMSIFVADEKLNNISSSVAKIPGFVAEANDELDAELDSIRRQLRLLCRGELPVWYNLL